MLRTIKFVAGGFFIPIVLILVLQAAAPHFLVIHERDFAGPELAKVPYELGTWQAHGDQQLDRAVTEYLKPDEYVLRDYFDRSTGSSVNLFLAYFKTLQNAWGPHSPRICLPGAGWMIQASSQPTIEVPGPVKGIPVNQYLLEKSGDHILVIYWYQNNRRIWAEEYLSKVRLLQDVAEYRRSDVSLIRLIMPLRGATVGTELDKTLEFARTVFPSLSERFASSN
jgi:EpsI family protein